jgi:hypothetical protein
MTVVSDATPELGLDIARLLGPFFLRPSTNQIFSGHAPSPHANSPLRLADASLRTVAQRKIKNEAAAEGRSMSNLARRIFGTLGI